jgi:hypothetical protein
MSQLLCAWTKRPNTHWIGNWVCPRDGLDVVAKRKIIPSPPLLEIKP